MSTGCCAVLLHSGVLQHEHHKRGELFCCWYRFCPTHSEGGSYAEVIFAFFSGTVTALFMSAFPPQNTLTLPPPVRQFDNDKAFSSSFSLSCSFIVQGYWVGPITLEEDASAGSTRRTTKSELDIASFCAGQGAARTCTHGTFHS